VRFDRKGLALSVISLAELYEGIYGARDPRLAEAGLRDFLSGVEILSVGETTCQIFGRERGRLRAARRIIGDFDLLIASSRAGTRAHVLLTNNRRHFGRIEKLRIESA